LSDQRKQEDRNVIRCVKMDGSISAAFALAATGDAYLPSASGASDCVATVRVMRDEEADILNVSR
jgi:hypothetical protein